VIASIADHGRGERADKWGRSISERGGVGDLSFNAMN
jgi:hypothetical protein